MQTNSQNGLKFLIGPSLAGWSWSLFDLSGAPLSSGEAKSRREAAAFVIREIVRATLPALAAQAQVQQLEAA